MNIPLKINAIYKKGNTPVVKYQEMANSTCARQIFKLFFEMLNVISGKMYAEMIDTMAERAGQNYDGITPCFDACHYEFFASFCGKSYEEAFDIAVGVGSPNDMTRIKISVRVASLLHKIYMDYRGSFGGANDECA